LEFRNTIVVSGSLSEIGAVRFTPAGLTVLNFQIEHQSTQKEAGIERTVQALFRCTLIGEKEARLTRFQVGRKIKVRGFMSAQSAKMMSRLVLHVTAYELMN
jgi:primosomal replication protein N